MSSSVFLSSSCAIDKFLFLSYFVSGVKPQALLPDPLPGILGIRPGCHLLNLMTPTSSASNASSDIPEVGYHGLQVGLVNCRSVCNKSADVRDVYEHYKLDCLALTETWLKSTDTAIIKDILPDNTSISMNCRVDRGGGVALISGNNLSLRDVDMKHECDGCEILVCKTAKLKPAITMVICYRPPNINSRVFIDSFSNILADLITVDGELLILGDFDFHVDESSSSGVNFDFSNMITDFGLKQLVAKPSHASGHTLDLVITRSNSSLVRNIVHQQGIADHDLLLINLRVPKSCPLFELKNVRSFRKINDDQISSLSAMINNSCIEDDGSGIDLVLDKLSDEMQVLAPPKSVQVRTDKPAPWLNSDIKRARRIRRKLERIYRFSKTEIDKQAMLSQIKVVQRMVKSAKCNYYTTMIDSNCGDRWKIINQLVRLNNQALPSLSRESLPDAFVDAFESKIDGIRCNLANQVIDNHPTVWSLNRNNMQQLVVLRPTDRDEVTAAIKSMPSSACPLDAAPGWFLKKLAVRCVDFLVSFINSSFSSGKYPQALKRAASKPIFKSGDKENITNYRLVSNVSFFAKLIERIAHNRFYAFTEENKLLSEFQSAYRKGHSVETVNLKVHNDLCRRADDGFVNLVVFLDLSSAFDTILHDKFLSVAEASCIEGLALKWLSSYMTDRSYFVFVGDSISADRSINYGAFQGTILGPWIFNLYMSPLAKIIEGHGLDFHIFSDDIQIYAFFRPGDAVSQRLCERKVITCLKDIMSWLAANGLLANNKKSMCILTGSKTDLGKCKTPNLLPYITASGFASDVKDLGFWLSANLDTKKHVSNASRGFYLALRNLWHIRPFIDVDTAKAAVVALATTRLDFCNSLLNGSTSSEISSMQRMQNAAARLVYGIRSRFTSASSLLRDLHWLRISSRVKFKTLVMVHKCIYGNAPSYLKSLLKICQGRTRSSLSCMLELPATKKSISDAAFSLSAPRLWNSLPVGLRLEESFEVFKAKLKTFLFDI
jgi:hypothetical protein